MLRGASALGLIAKEVDGSLCELVMSSDSLAALFPAGGGSAAKATGLLSDMVGDGTGTIRRCGCYLCQGRGLLSGDIQTPGMFSRDAINVYLDPEIYSVGPRDSSNV